VCRKSHHFNGFKPGVALEKSRKIAMKLHRRGDPSIQCFSIEEVHRLYDAAKQIVMDKKL